MKHSESIKELATALAKAQRLMQEAKKDSDNPYYNSKYADLAAVWRACRDSLSSNGLSVSQGTELIDGKMCLVSLLLHESGEWIRSEMLLPLPDADAQEYNKQGKAVKKNMLQAIASAMTYVRRITLSGLVGVAPDDETDDDAESTREAIKNKSIKEVEKIDQEAVKKFIDEYKLLDTSNEMTKYVINLAIKTDRKMSEMYEHCYKNKKAFLETYEKFRLKNESKDNNQQDQLRSDVNVSEHHES